MPPSFVTLDHRFTLLLVRCTDISILPYAIWLGAQVCVQLWIILQAVPLRAYVHFQFKSVYDASQNQPVLPLE